MSDVVAMHVNTVENCFSDSPALASALAQAVAADLSMGIAARAAALLAVSGGRTPAGFLAQLSRQSLAWERVTVTLVDERWLPPQDERSNERMLRASLLQNQAAAAQFVPLYTQAPDPESALPAIAARFTALALPFDAVVLGMGVDGHVASLFPGGEGLDAALDPAGTVCIASMRAPAAVVPRITLTLSALLATRALYLHFEGAEKRRVFESAVRGDRETGDFPISAVMRHARIPIRVFWCP